MKEKKEDKIQKRVKDCFNYEPTEEEVKKMYDDDFFENLLQNIENDSSNASSKNDGE